MVNVLRRAFLLGIGGTLGGAALAPALGASTRRAPREVALLSTYVAGTAYHAAPERAPLLRPGDEVVLRRRPDSAYDARAVEVWTADGAKLGCVPRIDNQALANLMDSGFGASARVRAVVPDAVRPEIRLDIALAIAA